MKRTLILMLASAMILTFTGMSMAIHIGSEDTGDNSGSLLTGPNLWTYITVEKPYTKWGLWPGTEKMYKGTQPHGAFLTTYVTKGAKQAIEKKKGNFANAAIIIKENYMPDKTLAAITVMYKAKGYNPEAGDWFWAKYNPDGSVAAEGKVEGCIKCHSAKADNNWVFTSDIK
ncbi:MAG: cytochrome P460 family protein [bacterium]|nr:cytochrome P460 family protein [bacterium]MDT8365430.1 cytochrome P460 family protein [bacterium]